MSEVSNITLSNPLKTMVNEHFSSTSSSSSSPNSDEIKGISMTNIEYFQNLSQDIYTFFNQIRDSDLINKLIPLLSIASNEKEQKPIEKFIWFCWSYHSNAIIQDYMGVIMTLLEEKDFIEALNLLNEVISIQLLIFLYHINQFNY